MAGVEASFSLLLSTMVKLDTNKDFSKKFLEALGECNGNKA